MIKDLGVNQCGCSGVKRYLRHSSCGHFGWIWAVVSKVGTGRRMCPRTSPRSIELLPLGLPPLFFLLIVLIYPTRLFVRYTKTFAIFSVHLIVLRVGLHTGGRGKMDKKINANIYYEIWSNDVKVVWHAHLFGRARYRRHWKHVSSVLGASAEHFDMVRRWTTVLTSIGS